MVPCMKLYVLMGQEFVSKNRIIEDYLYKEWYNEYSNKIMEALGQFLKLFLHETITRKIKANCIEAICLEFQSFVAHI